MLRRIFTALGNLGARIDALAESFREANERFRDNLGLDAPAEPERVEKQTEIVNRRSDRGKRRRPAR